MDRIRKLQNGIGNSKRVVNLTTHTSNCLGNPALEVGKATHACTHHGGGLKHQHKNHEESVCKYRDPLALLMTTSIRVMFVWAQAEKLRKSEYQRRQRRLIIEDALIIFWVCDSRYPKENHERSTTQNRLRPKHCYWNTCHTSKWDLPWSCQKMAIHVSIVSIILPLQQIVVMPFALAAKEFCDAFLASGPRKRERSHFSPLAIVLKTVIKWEASRTVWMSEIADEGEQVKRGTWTINLNVQRSLRTIWPRLTCPMSKFQLIFGWCIAKRKHSLGESWWELSDVFSYGVWFGLFLA